MGSFLSPVLGGCGACHGGELAGKFRRECSRRNQVQGFVPGNLNSPPPGLREWMLSKRRTRALPGRGSWLRHVLMADSFLLPFIHSLAVPQKEGGSLSSSQAHLEYSKVQDQPFFNHPSIFSGSCPVHRGLGEWMGDSKHLLQGLQHCHGEGGHWAARWPGGGERHAGG